MRALIAQAIEERQLLRMVLDGRRRITVEPYALGVTAAGQDALLCRQVMPPVPRGADWRIYHLGQMSSLQILDYCFDFPPSARHQLIGRIAEITVMV